MISHHARACWILMLLFVLSSAHGAWAGPPSDQLSAGIERVLPRAESRSEAVATIRRLASAEVG